MMWLRPSKNIISAAFDIHCTQCWLRLILQSLELKDNAALRHRSVSFRCLLRICDQDRSGQSNWGGLNNGLHRAMKHKPKRVTNWKPNCNSSTCIGQGTSPLSPNGYANPSKRTISNMDLITVCAHSKMSNNHGALLYILLLSDIR